jgi:RNA polymerase sigma-70 factor (ECF subfamily)
MARVQVVQTLVLQRTELLRGIAILERRHAAPCCCHQQLLEAEETLETLGEVTERALLRADDHDSQRSSAFCWIMGIAANILKERWRKTSREQKHCVSQTTLGESGWQAILAGLCTELPAPASADPGDELRQALAALKPDSQLVLRRRYYEEMDTPTLAQVLGISPDAVRARISRALRALREELLRLRQRRNGDA